MSSTKDVAVGDERSAPTPFASSATEWSVVLLPTVLGTRAFSSAASLLGGMFIALAVFASRVRNTYALHLGPLVTLAAATLLVLSRSQSQERLISFFLLLAIVIRLIYTVDARTIISSLLDGVGLCLIVNALGSIAGLKAPEAANRIRESLTDQGLTRVIYPLFSGLDAGPTFAAVYIAGLTFLRFEGQSTLRLFRLASLAAASTVLLMGASRTSFFIALALPFIAFIVPRAIPGIAFTLAAFAPISAIALPTVMSLATNFLTPAVSLIPGRETRSSDLLTLNNRDYIWRSSVDFWVNHVHGAYNWLIGFGQHGQMTSGASLSYGKALAGTIRHPERASLHNAYFQQLFDGGVIGWLLFSGAIFWAVLRLSRARPRWGNYGMAAILMICALLTSSTTQVSISPGIGQEPFWLLVIIVAISCQGQFHLHGNQSEGSTSA